MTGAVIVVMARTPEPGTGKTRLRPLLGPEGAARLQQALLTSAAATAAGSGMATRVVLTGGGAGPDVRTLIGAEATRHRQRGEDLGQRMSAAVSEALAAGASAVIVIGTDVPTLTSSELVGAADVLASCDVVLGPAEDGGYYLVAVRQAHRAVFGLDPALWGGAAVLSTTLERCRRAGLDVRLLAAHRDLDRPDDALALREDPRVPTAVRAALVPVPAAP